MRAGWSAARTTGQRDRPVQRPGGRRTALRRRAGSRHLAGAACGGALQRALSKARVSFGSNTGRPRPPPAGEFEVLRRRHPAFRGRPAIPDLAPASPALAFLLPRGHPLAARESVSAEELLSFRWRPTSAAEHPQGAGGPRRASRLPARPSSARTAAACSAWFSPRMPSASAAASATWRRRTGRPASAAGARAPDDLDELHTRYGIVSRAGYSLSPLAEAMIDELKRVDGATWLRRTHASYVPNALAAGRGGPRNEASFPFREPS